MFSAWQKKKEMKKHTWMKIGMHHRAANEIWEYVEQLRYK